MNNLIDIISSINDRMVEDFKSVIGPVEKVTKKEYLSLFLGTFLNSQLFSKTENMNLKDFILHCRIILNQTSLCGQEIEFFNIILDLDSTNNYIQRCKAVYKKIDRLEDCQLANAIWGCLEESNHLEII